MASCTGSAQIAIRAHGSNKCPLHYGKVVVCFCENCDDLVCMDCITKEHKGHDFEDISNVIPAAKEKLQCFINQAEQTQMPGIRGKLQEADNHLGKNKNHFKTQISKVRKQNEDLKKELDKIAETLVKTYKKMEEQNSSELLRYKEDLQTRIDKLASQMLEFRKTLQSGSDILVFDTSHAILSKLDAVTLPVNNTPEFTPGKIVITELEKLFGKLGNSTVHNQPLSNLPGNWKVTSEFNITYEGHSITSIQAAEDDGGWLCFYNSKTKKNTDKILLTDQSGNVKQTLKLDVTVHDFCISLNTRNIWFCSRPDNTVREVKGGKSVVRFTTSSVPYCICMTQDDHIIIGYHKQAVKYTQGGQEVCRTSGGYPPVVRTPFHLSECPLTSNLAVVDLDWMEHGGNDKPFVSILNPQLQPLYTYSGHLQGLQTQQSFFPRDVCYTRSGELVITDHDNKSVLLVSETGRYLKTLYQSKSEPKAVCVTHSGALWVTFQDGCVQVLQNN